MSPLYRVFGRDVIAPTTGGMTRAQRELISFDQVKNQGSTLAEMREFMSRFTGVLPGIPRAQTANDVTITTTGAGQVIENLDILGKVVVAHNDVIIRNCTVRNMSVRNNASDSHFIVCTSATRNLLVEDVTIGPPRDGLSYRMDGIRTCGYTAKRVHLTGSTDGFGVINDSSGAANVAILGSWVENMTKVCPDFGDGGPSSGHTDGTHNDGIQWQGGTGLHLQGCLMQGRIHPTLGNTGGIQTMNDAGTPACLTRNTYGTPVTQTNAVIQFNNNTAFGMGGGLIEDNWFDGGLNTLNCDVNLATTGQDLGTIQNNIFTLRTPTTGNETNASGQYTPYNLLAPINVKAGYTVTIVGNVHDDGSAVPIRRGA